MKTKILKDLLVELKKGQKIYKFKDRVVFKFELPKVRKTASFIILSSRDFNLENIQKIVSNIELLQNDYALDVVFVVGDETSESQLLNLYANKFYKCVISKEATQPVFSSLKCGVRALFRESIGAVVIFGNRLPPSETTLRTILDHLLSGASIVIPLRDGKRTHPIAFSLSMFENILNVRKEKGIPYLLRKYREEIKFVSI